MKKKEIVMATAGVLAGIVISGPAAQAADAILAARPSSNRFYVDGKQTALEAYVINDYNYIKLGDLSAKLGFDLTYEPDTRNVYIGEVPKQAAPAYPSVTDYSAQANPAVFNETLTRELYNAIRDAVVHRDVILAGSYQPLAIDRTDELRQAMDTVTVTIGSYPSYEPTSPQSGKLACKVKQPSSYAAAVAHTQKFVDGLAGNSQEVQVGEIAWYVCDRLTYSTALASPAKVLASDGVTAGNCMSYAHSFQFLCDRAGVPCLLVHSATHQWNRVYVNGRWWDVDLTGLDVGDNASARGDTEVLRDNLQGKTFRNAAPEVTAFAMEILVPGSTK